MFRLNLKYLSLLAGYIAVTSIILVLVKLFFVADLFNESNFLNWDAMHYFNISRTGYSGSDIAFFPLFPYMWRYLNLSATGISIINGLIFIITIFWLMIELKPARGVAFLLLSIPSAIFFFLPYSESVFFAGTVAIIIGLKNNQLWKTALGLLICSLARPAISVYLPALILVELFYFQNIKHFVWRLLLYAGVMIAGLMLVALVQYADTGRWFEFFTVQKDWGSKLQFPKIPFTSWAGGIIVRLDAASALIGVASGLVLILKMLKVNFLQKFILPRELVFSLAYLGGITLSVIIFRGGSLHSLNRFVFAVPLIMVVIHYWSQFSFTLNTRQLVFIGIGLLCCTTLFGSYVHIQYLIRFVGLTLYLLLFVTTKHQNARASKVGLVSLILINYAFQIYFYIRFLSSGWVA